ncbi:MAG: nuclear transport factor 2 family protein, partial [Pseudonocardia sp.]|nr:nuclear transport factor 2 family protein [Pseudonocardia sp.]
PSASLRLEPELLGRFPVGYRHLGYLQAKSGFTVKADMPGLTGPLVRRLYAEGAAWLAGSELPGQPT